MHVGLSLLTLASGRSTGTGTYVRGLLKEFERGNGPDEVTVLLRDRAVDDFSELRNGPLNLAVLPSSRSGTNLASRLSALSPTWLQSPRVCRLLAGLDVLHYPLTLPVPRTRLPCVLTLHDVQHHDLPELFSRAQHTWRRAAYDNAARRATVVIAVSGHAKGRIVERIGIAPDRIEVAHHGIDTRRFTSGWTSGDEEALAAYGLPERFLFYPAALWPHKNHNRLLDSLAAVDDPELGVVFTGPRFGGGARLMEGVARRRLGERVRHLGPVPPTVVPALYRRAAALIFPSLYEGFGTPPLEAMACGCPVACSSAASLPEICGDAALMFDPGSTESIAAAVRRIVSDSDLRGRLRQAGVERAREFTWRRAAQRHQAAFERALALGPQAHA